MSKCARSASLGTFGVGRSDIFGFVNLFDGKGQKNSNLIFIERWMHKSQEYGIDLRLTCKVQSIRPYCNDDLFVVHQQHDSSSLVW